MKSFNIRRKIAAIAGAIGLTGIILMGTGTAANADTYDCFPAGCAGYYTSADSGGGSHFGWDAAPESGSGAMITWTSSSIYVSGPVKDVKADGQGAVGEARICPGGTQLCSYFFTHVTAGAGNYKIMSAGVYNVRVTDGSTVELRACNGYDAAGNPENCNSWHGPFHNY